MPADEVSIIAKPSSPPVARADRCRVLEQSGFLLLEAQPGELLPQRVILVEEVLLPVKHRRVLALAVIEALQLPRPNVQLDRSEQRRVRVVIEVRIEQVGDLP